MGGSRTGRMGFSRRVVMTRCQRRARLMANKAGRTGRGRSADRPYGVVSPDCDDAVPTAGPIDGEYIAARVVGGSRTAPTGWQCIRSVLLPSQRAYLSHSRLP